MTIELGRTKTSEAEEGRAVKLVGRPVEALTAWLESEGITSGPVFLHIDRWENVGERPVSPAGINHMIKRRLVMAGYNETDYSAHGLRACYLNNAAKAVVPSTQAMRQYQHRSMPQAAYNYNDANAR